MKKIYVFAAVAIAALASCTKSEAVYNQGQQEIGFRQFTGAMTKANEALSGYASTMGVFAYHNGIDGTTGTNVTTLYIDNGSFKEKTTSSGIWGGATPYYWPLQGTLDFIVYAPHQASGVNYVLGDKKLTVDIDNSGEQQIDYLYGKEWYDGLSKTDSPVSVVLKHALSKVTINVGASEEGIFTVSSVLLKDTYQAGSYEVSYTSGTGDISFGTTESPKVGMEFVASPSSPWKPTTTVTACTASKLVVPSNQTSIVITYKMKGSEAVLTATVDLSSASATWDTGKHYTYNLILTADEILFVPSVEDWKDQDASDVPVINS